MGDLDLFQTESGEKKKWMLKGGMWGGWEVSTEGYSRETRKFRGGGEIVLWRGVVFDVVVVGAAS